MNLVTPPRPATSPRQIRLLHSARFGAAHETVRERNGYLSAPARDCNPLSENSLSGRNGWQLPTILSGGRAVCILTPLVYIHGYVSMSMN